MLTLSALPTTAAMGTELLLLTKVVLPFYLLDTVPRAPRKIGVEILKVVV